MCREQALDSLAQLTVFPARRVKVCDAFRGTAFFQGCEEDGFCGGLLGHGKVS